jgi:murein DD-endopeptidase MepM/ murein hydrolase activator NlpD
MVTKDKVTKVSAFVLAILLAFTGIITFNLPTPSAKTLEELQAEERKYAEELAELKTSMEGVNDDLAAAVVQLDDILNYKLPAATERLNNANAEAERTQKIADDLRKRLTAAEQLLKQSQNALKNAKTGYDSARESLAYVTRTEARGSNELAALQVVFNAGDATDFINTLESNDAMRRLESRLMNEHANSISIEKGRAQKGSTIKELVDSLRKEAEANEKAAESARIEAQTAKNEIDSLRSQYESLKVELENKKVELEESKKRAQKAYDSTMSAIGLLNPSGGGTGGGLIPPNAKSKFWYPVQNPRITCGFYDCAGYFTTCIQHKATDFGAPCGTPVYASASGTVVGSGYDWTSGGAIYVGINHGSFDGYNWGSVYYHLQSHVVANGQYVERGQLIGYVGNTGWSTGCHLHFAVTQNGAYVDPMALLS